jgi:hypothetical protein
MLKETLEQIKTEIASVFSAGTFDVGSISGTTSANVVMSVVNLKEEKTLKNTAYSRVNPTSLKTEYFNPFIYLNVYLIFCSKKDTHLIAIEDVAKVISFFHGKNIFEVSVGGESFKVILDMYSPNFEELNHIWAILGGKMYPSVMYMMRVVEIKSNNVMEGAGIVEEIRSGFLVKN